MSIKKPKDVNYTQMAMFIDAHAYDEPKTPELEKKLYEYMYHLFYMLACKAKYFIKLEDYENFAHYGATRLYMRYINPKQFQEDSKIDKIVSCLNYIKLIIYGTKTDYQRENFREVINPDVNSEFDPIAYSQRMAGIVQQDYYMGLEEDVVNEINYIGHIVNDVVDDTPYKSDKLMIKNLKISCLLSLLNTITLNNVSVKRLERKKDKKSIITQDVLDKMYDKEKENAIILWHLDDNMTDVVKVLVNKIRNIFCDNVVETKKSYELPDNLMESILMTAFDSSDGENNNEKN